jgi:ribulose-5-phosphate 4-epimerase/fuculose-1-phosphate aldolase
MLHERNIQAEIPSLQGKVSPEEWQARVDLAACYRLVALYDMSDMVANHISMRVPGEDNSFLINAYGMLYEEVTASSLIKIDHGGNILMKPEFGDLGYGINRAGFVIHSAVHEAKPEIACVIHTHTWAGMAIASLEVGLLPLTQTAMRFAKIGYHDYHGVVLDMAEKEELVKNLGDNNAMILRNHGLLTVGRTIAEAFNAMHRLEMSCRSQLAAMACGVKLNEVPDDIVEKTYMNYQPQVRRPFGVLEWPALLRKLDKIDPSYRN